MLQKYVIGVDHVALQLPDLDEGLWFFNDRRLHVRSLSWGSITPLAH
jgi:hypothetical protein